MGERQQYQGSGLRCNDGISKSAISRTLMLHDANLPAACPKLLHEECNLSKFVQFMHSHEPVADALQML